MQTYALDAQCSVDVDICTCWAYCVLCFLPPRLSAVTIAAGLAQCVESCVSAGLCEG
jgi:hypothetical protein